MSGLTPGSKEWASRVTASKVAAILGHSPFMSQRTVWHLMRGEYDVPVTDAMLRGQYLEDGVLRWWADQNPDYDRQTNQPSYRLGDWAAATPDMIADVSPVGSPVLVEAKTSSNDDEWGREGTDEIPTHYLTQCYWAMHVSGIHETRVPVLTSRLVFREYVVLHDPEVGALLEERCRAFYDSLTADVPPPLDDTISTFECMRQIHPDITPRETVELPLHLAHDFLTARAVAHDADAQQRAARSAMYDLAGNAQYLMCNGVLVARRQASPSGGVSIIAVAKSPADLPDRER